MSAADMFWAEDPLPIPARPAMPAPREPRRLDQGYRHRAPVIDAPLLPTSWTQADIVAARRLLGIVATRRCSCTRRTRSCDSCRARAFMARPAR